MSKTPTPKKIGTASDAKEDLGARGSSMDHLFGCWSAQEEREFLQAIEVFEQIEDPLVKQQGLSLFRDLGDLAGSWSEEETQEFKAVTKAFNQVDEDLWK